MTDRRRKRPTDPVPLGPSIDAVTRELTGASATAITEVIDGFVGALGAGLASGLTPRSLVRGVLTVEVADGARHAELRFQETEIVARLQARFGIATVERIRTVRSR